METAALALILLLALALQAVLPSRRLLIVSGGAATSCLVSSVSGSATTKAILSGVPWDVLVMLVALGLLSEVLARTKVFGVSALWVTRKSGADTRRVLVFFPVAMFLVSGLVNNLTALLLVLPVLLILFRLVTVDQRQLSWTIGLVLVACNLGGAATPIGDFPAILLLGTGAMDFREYLLWAFPVTVVALCVLLALAAFVVRPDRDAPADPLSRKLSLAVMGALYRRVRIDMRLLLPLVAVLAAMLVAWAFVPQESGVGPELICWLGVAIALAIRPALGEAAIRHRVSFEPVLFLLSLFVMVAAVSHTGAFGSLARGIRSLPVSPEAQLIVFLLLAGVLTGIFSAGPSMAALLEVADSLTANLPPHAVYVGLALSVCAGSSLFLTAATSGPMAQILTEGARLRDAGGKSIHFGFFEFVPVGLLSFAVIQSAAIGFALFTI